mmetsp:Transcript_22933/g.54134  ORF Transcript_22933/g.54134 Transcript_22933/m.54134 type:complete len:408 (+) Transcript_22933:195-1418(+)|eukprot:CAMPEP_0172391394 /NCGR_PEP_ID=MMETSP1061-20121228/7801_1 /TAXON_ID=37318 /ORGANISM="Pseudo-nitzschia pungens, Strain cf. pungens" /LENGTH=407 /DNA_ID=CAMNT_0013122003 /DNA_START=128 /DNA_END=1351 /DNA_ORIENTATION=-
MTREGTRISTLFFPALCVYPLWLTIGIREDVLVSSMAEYYPMMIAMVLGSMIAGSTPLGGGVVAFPVSVLVLGFRPDQGRDFSLLIQSVGMTAASFLIFYKKRHLLRGCEDIIVQFCVLSIIGVVIGFECFSSASPYVVNITYTTAVACIALVLAYFDVVVGAERTESNARNGTTRDVEDDLNVDGDDVINGNKIVMPCELSVDSEMIHMDSALTTVDDRGRTVQMFAECLCIVIFAIAGGILSSQIGTGADIACYFYGFLYNAMQSCFGQSRTRVSEPKKISGNALTAASIIVMANTSVFGSLLRITTGTQHNSLAMVDSEVYYALMACAPVVVLGAPVGSLFLTLSNQQRLKYVFYVLGILQLVLFGLIKIGKDYIAWTTMAGIILLVLTCLGIHNVLYYRQPRK